MPVCRITSSKVLTEPFGLCFSWGKPKKFNRLLLDLKCPRRGAPGPRERCTHKVALISDRLLLTMMADARRFLRRWGELDYCLA